MMTGVKRRLLFYVLILLAACLTRGVAKAEGNALVDAGIPALDREWTGTDYATAVAVLKSGKVPLPTLADKQGSAFFQKLTSTQNFALEQDQALPINNRLADYLKLMEGMGTALALYVEAENSGAKLHVELAQYMVFSLRTAQLGKQLADEFFAKLPHDDKYDARMEGKKEMESGLTTMFQGAVTSLSEKTIYTDEDRSVLLQGMAETLPVLKKAFPEGYKQELLKKLQSYKTSFTKEKDAAAIQQMIDELGRN